MSLMEISLVVLVPLVLIGGMAAALFGFIYGIVKKRPGVIAASVAAPFVLLVGGFLFVGLARFTSEQAKQTSTTWTPTVELPPMPSMPPMPAMQQIQFQASTNPAWIKVAILFLIVGGIIFLARKCMSCNWQRSGSWIKTLVIAVLVIAAVNVSLRVQRGRNRVAAEVEQRVELTRRDAEIARQNEVHARQYAEVAAVAEQRANELLASHSMQEMWEKLNQPRIKLDGAEHGATMTVGEGAEQVTLESPPTDGKQSIAPMAEQTPESLASSLARLERMVTQVSAVANQVSDTGTLIGKAMVALNETMDSRSRTKGNIPKTTADTTIEKLEVVNHSSVTATPVLAEAIIPTRTAVEIVFDEGRLNQFATTFEKIKEILGRDGFWRGTTVRFVPEEGRIVVTGDIGNDFAERLNSTLINTVGKHRTPVHLSDLATVTSEHGEMSRDVASWTRPVWIDEPPRRIGNVRREVVETDEYATTDECARAADVYLLLKTYEHFQQLSGMPHGDNTLPSLTFRAQDHAIMTTDGYVIFQQDGNTGYWHDPRILALQAVGVDLDFIRREIVPANREYYETVERSFGPMKKLYTQVEFSPSIDQELLRRWDEFRRSERFVDIGVGAGSVLGLIGLAFGLLRVDTWTKGYYSKRLFLGVPAAIIGMITLLLVAAG